MGESAEDDEQGQKLVEIIIIVIDGMAGCFNRSRLPGVRDIRSVRRSARRSKVRQRRG